MDVLEIIKTAQKYKMNVGPQGFRFMLKCQAVHVRHTNIRKDNIHLVILQN